MKITITTTPEQSVIYFPVNDFPVCTIGRCDDGRLVLKVVSELFFISSQTYIVVDNKSKTPKIRKLFKDEIINLKVEGE